MVQLCAAGVTLRNQINTRFPRRDKASDGWIGDNAHANRSGWGLNGKGSYHNPAPSGYVHALDIDEDFGAQGDSMRFARQLADYCRMGLDDGRVVHIVYEGQVASATAGDWDFRGSGYGHTHHIHISFSAKADKDGSKFYLPILKIPRR